MAPRGSLDSPGFYYGSFTTEQWEVIVAALVALDTEESRVLACDITTLILPPRDS